MLYRNLFVSILKLLLDYLLHSVNPGPKQPLAPVEISPAPPVTILTVNFTGLILPLIIGVFVHGPLDGKRNESADTENHEQG